LPSKKPQAQPLIQHFVGLNRTPALSLAVRGWMALIESGHCPNIIQIFADQNALLASIAEKPVGVLTYRHDRVLKELLIGIGYVLPEYRRRGVYHLLWDALVAKAQEFGIPQIVSTTFVGNDGLRAVARAQERSESQLVLEYEVPKS
jgi:hypothetical protein